MAGKMRAGNNNGRQACHGGERERTYAVKPLRLTLNEVGSQQRTENHSAHTMDNTLQKATLLKAGD